MVIRVVISKVVKASLGRVLNLVLHVKGERVARSPIQHETGYGCTHDCVTV